MGTFPTRKDIPPWVKIPEDLKDPEVFQVQTLVLKFLFGEWQVLRPAAKLRPRLPGLDPSFPFSNRPTRLSNPSLREGEPGYVRTEDPGVFRTHRGLSLWLLQPQASGQMDASVHG